MNTKPISVDLLTPPMPVMANDDIGGIGVLRAIQRNAFEAFPKRCWQDPLVRLKTPIRPVVIATSPESIRHIMLDCHPDYVRLPVGKRVLSPIVGDGLLVSEGGNVEALLACIPDGTTRRTHARTKSAATKFLQPR